MICSDLFAEFIQVLTEDEDAVSVEQRAFSVLADAYHMGKVDIDFSVPSTAYTPNGDKLTGSVLLTDGEISQNQVYEKILHTGEGGTLVLTVYSVEGAADWTAEEKKDLDIILSVFYFHLGRYRLIEIVKKSAMTEYMTGLPNTGGFLEYAKKLQDEGTLKKYNAYYFNLKGFGLINRKFGQREADEIIKRYAKTLTDFAGDNECIGRLGGDNFVALIKKERTEDFLKLIGEVRTYGLVDGQSIPVIISSVAGVFEIDDSLSNYGQVISRCAVALNIAKNVTKQPYMFVTKEMNNRVFREKQIAARFSDALKNGEFVVYYQPKVETDSYTIVGAEALVRWFSDGKMISPGEFIPIIERDGSICRLDFYMLEQVCRDIQRWIQKGLEPVRVSVNFSRKHLSNPHLAEDIIHIIEKYGISSRYIEIEVTETTDEEEQGMLSSFMLKMREYEIATAIDDFGTGYSSLNILRTFPVDVLKIDKSFIDNGVITENDGIVLTNIVRMAKQLNMDVITEGVENWEQVEFLHDIECNTVQGFLFDKPMPEEDFEEKIQTRQYDVTSVRDYIES